MTNRIFSISIPSRIHSVASKEFDFPYPLRQFHFTEYGSRKKAMNFDEEPRD